MFIREKMRVDETVMGRKIGIISSQWMVTYRNINVSIVIRPVISRRIVQTLVIIRVSLKMLFVSHEG